MRRLIYVAIAVIIVASSVFAGGQEEVDASNIDTFDWRNFEGQEIRFVSLNFYYTNFLKEYVPEFEELTGIDVRIETYPENQHYQKVIVELAAGSDSLDVFATAGNANEGFRYHQSGWYEPLDPYIDSEVLTNPDWDPEDFFPSVYDAQIIDGDRIAIPMNAVTWVLYYRKDVFAESNLDVPETMEELVEAATTLHSPPNFFGYVGRGSKAQGAMTWSNFLYNYGGRWLDDERRPAFNSDAGVRALEVYADLMANYSNPGSTSNEWTDVQALMQQGQAAMIISPNAWLGAFTDPEKSKISDDFGTAVVPHAEGVEPTSVLWSWNLAISPNSNNKEAAWLFIQWATSKEIQRRIQEQNFVTSRRSAWDSDRYQANVREDWLDATLASFDHAQPILFAQAVPSAEINDLVGTAIVHAVQGSMTPRQALDEVATQVDQLLSE